MTTPMTTRSVSMEWNLRQMMATRGLFATSDLIPLLTARGIHLSREQVHRLVTKTPQRLNIEVLAALCDGLDCAPNDLLVPVVTAAPKTTKAAVGGPGPKVGSLRPIRARVRTPYDEQ
jgi:DNA-binding Xre family transcriptional regulator